MTNITTILSVCLSFFPLSFFFFYSFRGDAAYGGDVSQGCVDTPCTVDASSTLNTGTAVERIYSNEFAFAAVYTTGQVITWGGQSQGGDMSSVVTDLDGTVGITAIYSTSTAFAALRTDGDVYCWGTYYYYYC